MSRDDLPEGSLMRQYAEENGFGKHPTMNLIASYFGEKIVISSEMASLYLKLGFNISEVTEVSIRSGPIHHPRSNPLQPPSRMIFFLHSLRVTPSPDEYDDGQQQQIFLIWFLLRLSIYAAA